MIPAELLEILKSEKINLETEISNLVKLPPPETCFNDATNHPFGQYARNTYARIIELVRSKKILDLMPDVKINIDKKEVESSPYNTFKLLLMTMSYFSIYCYDKIKSDDSHFVDAMAEPMKKLTFDTTWSSEIINYYLVNNHATQLVCASKWISSFSKENIPSFLKLVFIKPILSYSSTMISARSKDQILETGIKLLRGVCSEVLKHIDKPMSVDMEELYSINQNSFNTHRFIKLATGDKVLSKKLGAKLYTEFERELAKVFDAWGYFVSHTTIGSNRADLIISTPKPNSYAFLIDAKSTKSRYSLPTTDSRAITTYVKNYVSSPDILC